MVAAIPVAPDKPFVSRWRRFATQLWPVNGATNAIAALDGLRGVAVLLTMLEHVCSETLNTSHDPVLLSILQRTKGIWEFGWSGVLLFFILSGFLLFLPYARCMLGLASFPSTRKFYIRRALRILPAYWLSLAIFVLLKAHDYLFNPQGWYDIGLHIFMVHNWTLATQTSLNAVFWTMAVESQFYLLLPLIAFVLVKLAHQKHFVLCGLGFIFLLLLAPLHTALYTFTQMNMPALLDHFPILDVFGFMSLFALGMICSLFYVSVTEGKGLRLSPARIRLFSTLAFVAGVAILALHTIFPGFLSDIDFTVTGFGYSGILLGTVLGWKGFAWLLAQPILRFIGIISYSLYIWNLTIYGHMIIPLALKANAWPLVFVLECVLTVLILIPFAFVCYYFVERPFIGVRRAQH